MQKKQTPLERLKSNKTRVQVLAQIQENKLNANFHYLQQNSGRLILHGITAAILPGSKSAPTDKVTPDSPSFSSEIIDMTLGGVANYFTKGKHLWPLAMRVAQPFLLTMGIKGAKKLIGNLFAGKKKEKR
ncbi:hypothetical protein [Parabacteroides sp. PF5-9]|uniref:hypothetical protein n=1 Tax=Parabacteroides sp. PF5-9 TaxID=1742404 RepID=UPI0024733557|nr:hypothetical protein [Parabacteroides sp. PF5-9]MDH6359137.1 hypothetical protein [Parabacteroides sp. PF5-9]